MGIAVSRNELALATTAQGWLLMMRDWPPVTSQPIIRGVLGKALTTERTAPALVTRDTGRLVMALEEWLGEYDRDPLLPNIVHDMGALEYATGRAIARDQSPLKDALDCAAVGPGLALEAPRFYREVGMPLVRFNSRVFQVRRGLVYPLASSGLPADPLVGSRWTLTYDWLLFKVLAHYTRDPTLIRWFQEGRSPMQEFASYLELDSKEAVAFLLWMVCGEKEELVSRYYPDWAACLPESLQLIKASRVDKNLPNLRMGFIRLTEQYAATRKTTTMYGRRSSWGLCPEELLHFVIMGSVNDLLDVVVASIIKLGSKQHWLIPASESKYSHWLRAKIVGYNQEEPMEWQRQLEELGCLNNPLGVVPLEPKVSVE